MAPPLNTGSLSAAPGSAGPTPSGFVWGAGGKPMSAAQARKHREIEAALMAKGGSPSNLGEGLNRVGEALLAVSYGKKAEQAETEGAASRKAVMDALMGNADPTMADISGALGNEWVSSDPASAAIVQALLGQEIQQNDPLRQQQLAMGEIELNNARNPPPAKPIEVGGVLLDPVTFEPVFDSRQPSENGFTLSPGQQRFDAQGNPIATAQPDPGFRLMTPEELQSVPGLDPRKAYQVGPDNKISEISGGGVNVSVGGNNDIGTIPPGMMVTRDEAGNVTGMKPIPGGPAELEAIAAAEAAALNDSRADLKGGVVVQDIDRALQSITANPGMTTGIGAAITGSVPSSPAYDVNALIDTVKANAGFAELQAMRESSPTGGALGNVTEKEIAYLQATIGNLDPRQSPQQLQDNLKRVKNAYLDVIHGAGNGPPREPLSFEGGAQPDAGPQSQPPAVTNQQEYEALEAGSPYLAPDGTIRTKGQ